MTKSLTIHLAVDRRYRISLLCRSRHSMALVSPCDLTVYHWERAQSITNVVFDVMVKEIFHAHIYVPIMSLLFQHIPCRAIP